MSEQGRDPGEAPRSFAPSASFQVGEGHRDIGLCFVGDALVAGYGDPKALGWVSRVLARTPARDLDLTAYNLGVRGSSSADLLGRWRAEAVPRWTGRGERRLVVGIGAGDVAGNITTARSRLNLANVLDECASTGVATFVVGPVPTLNPEQNARLEVLSDAQADVCARRSVPFVECFRSLLGHEQWQQDLTAGDGEHPGQAGYGLIAWLVLHAGWHGWMQIEA